LIHGIAAGDGLRHYREWLGITLVWWKYSNQQSQRKALSLLPNRFAPSGKANCALQKDDGQPSPWEGKSQHRLHACVGKAVLKRLTDSRLIPTNPRYRSTAMTPGVLQIRKDILKGPGAAILSDLAGLCSALAHL
jgi:hypothetical protein